MCRHAKEFGRPVAQHLPMETTPRVVGAGPVLRALCEEIGLVGAMDAVVPWDRARCRLSPGERILAVVLNLLTARQPLYRAQEQYTLADPPLLLGTGITPADLSEEALGRALDKVAAADGAAVVSAVPRRALTADRVLPDAAPLRVCSIGTAPPGPCMGPIRPRRRTARASTPRTAIRRTIGRTSGRLY